MSQLLRPTIIRVRDRTAGGMRSLGTAHMETFTAFERTEEKHLFRNGEESAEDAIQSGKGAWGMDLAIMEALTRDHNIKYVEIPTPRGVYRTKMETLLGPKSYHREFAGHRVQVFLPLQYWTLATR